MRQLASGITEEAQQTLLDRGVRTVIDLRNEREVAAKKNVFEQSDKVNYHNISLINPANYTELRLRDLADMYIMLIERSRDEMRSVFTILANPIESATLFHCAAGKDRTGVIAALLLDLAGVPHEQIAEDYALTSTCITPLMDELRSDRPAEIPADIYENFLACHPEYMYKFLSHLEENYGNAESYLTAIGVSKEQIRVIWSKFVHEN